MTKKGQKVEGDVFVVHFSANVRALEKMIYSGLVADTLEYRTKKKNCGNIMFISVRFHLL